MASKSRLTERLAVIGTVDPDANTAATYNTDEINMKNFTRVIFIVMAGALGTSATVDFSVSGGASSNAGSHATAVTGKAITQLTEAGGDSDKQAIVEVTAEECAAQGLQYIEGALVVATATSDCAVIVLGEPAHYSNAPDVDLASVAEIVA
jgi:hypothetical protein